MPALLAPELVRGIAQRFPSHAVVGAAGYLRGTNATTFKDLCARLGIKTARDLATHLAGLEEAFAALRPDEAAAISLACETWLRALDRASPKAPTVGPAPTPARPIRTAPAPREGVAAVVDPSEPPPDGRDAVWGWARANGVAAILSLTMGEIDRSIGSSAASIVVDDVFLPVQVPSAGAAHASWIAQLRRTARGYLASAAEIRATSMQARDLRLSRALPPSALPPPVRALHAIVERLVARLHEAGVVAPWTSVGYPRATVRFLESPPARFETTPDTRLATTVRLPIAELLANTFDPFAAAPGHRATAREETLVGLSAVLDFLRDEGAIEAQAARAWLEVPLWSRALSRAAALESAIELSASSDERLAFRLVTEERRLRQVELLVQAPRRTGGFLAGRRVSASVALGFARSALERRLVELVGELEASQWSLTRASDAGRFVTLLAALGDHPRVVLDGPSAPPAHFERTRVKLTLTARAEGHGIDFAIGDVPLPIADLAAARLEDGSVVVVDQATDRVLSASLAGVAGTLVVALAEYPAAFPPEALGPLLDMISRAQESVEIEVPDDLVGATAEADPRPVVRLTLASNDTLFVDVRVRPLANGALVEPGTGSPRVFGHDGAQRISTLRDLETERLLAERLITELSLGDIVREAAFSLRIGDLDRAADLIAALSGRDEITIEWSDGGAVKVSRIGRGQIQLRVARRRDWFGIEGGVEIDGTTIGLAALLAATRSGHRFVRVSGHQIVAIGKDLRERLRAVDDAVHVGAAGIEASTLAIEALDGLVEDEAQLEASQDWLTARARWTAAATYDPVLPVALAATLRSYQLEGFRWLARLAEWSPGACLADDMGLGKTVQTLALLLHRAHEGPTLVLAPTTVGPNWLAEAARFAPTLRVRSYRGAGRAQLLADLAPGDLLVTSYDLALRDRELLRAVTFGTLVLDEAQAIKNAASRRAQAVRDLDAHFRLALTGTPIENHLGELWSLFRAIAPALLGSIERFRGRFAVPIERDRDAEKRRALSHVVAPFLLRRTKAIVARELPARTETVRLVTLSPGERERYEQERLAAIAAMRDADPVEGRFTVLAAITRLRRLACNVALVDRDSVIPSQKLAAFLELATELREAGHRALVFSQFTSHLALVRAALDARGASSLYLDGQTPSAERERLVRVFQEGQADFFLLSLKAGGTGINLTAADYVVHLDPWWNPAAEDQATDRAHRIGQVKPVTVVRLVSAGTIEEAVLALHAQKRELAESLLAGKDLAARLSAQELIDLVRAGESAAEETEPVESDEPAEGAARPYLPNDVTQRLAAHVTLGCWPAAVAFVPSSAVGAGRGHLTKEQS